MNLLMSDQCYVYRNLLMSDLCDVYRNLLMSDLCYVYRNLLMSDLCKHYEYNEFLMLQLMDLFPYGELLDLLGKLLMY